MTRRLARFAIKGCRPDSSGLCIAAWLCGLVAAVVVVLGAPVANAQDNFGIDSYITPFPKNDVYEVRMVGDSLAAGLQYAIADSLGKDPRVRVNPQRWTLKRLTSNSFDSQMRALQEDAQTAGLNVAVVMAGTWDRRNVRDSNGRRLSKGSEAWRAEFGRRVDATMKTLKKARVAVYWVGLPPFRRSDANELVQIMNEVFRERAYLNGVRFIDAYQNFVGEESAYAAYGPDLSGKIKLLRERDGIHLSYTGNQKLAYFVERAIKRDMDQARRERAIPLDGDVAQQSAIRPETAPETKTDASSTMSWLTGTSQVPAESDGGISRGFFGAGRGGEQKAENSRISLSTVDPNGREQIISVDIVRPAIPASIVALVTRKQREDRLAEMGDRIVDKISGGLSIMSSVTPANQLSRPGGGRFSPAQTPFFKVLVKGERVEPRVGRADDATWPRPAPPPRQRMTRSLQPKSSGRRPGDPIDLTPVGGDGGVPLPGINPFRPRA